MIRFLVVYGLFAAATTMGSAANAQSQCPDDFVAFRNSGQPLACSCSADATERGFVYGMDIYTDDSSICRSALHAGIVSTHGGGVTVLPLPGQQAYAGVTRNGVSSSNWGKMEGSFSFVPSGAAVAPPAQPQVMVQPVPAPSPPPQPAPAAPVFVVQPKASVPATNAGGLATMCPDNFVSYRGTSQPLTCGCTRDGVEIGFVYGMDIYTDDSGICKAAVHAGVLSPAGDANVTLFPLPGRDAYAGVTRNGISSSNWGRMDGSFQFSPVALPAPVAVIPAMTQPPATASICPDNFVAFAGTTQPLACGCSEEAAANGFAYGMDIYTDDSSICRAALHAGFISPKGGNVTLLPLPGQPFYPGVTRNGVSSSNWGRHANSFTFASAGGQASADAPTQQPIGQTLATTGQVQLYIHFAFNSDQLVPEATPVMEELLAVLRADPSMKLALIGHTDSVGGADYNLTLSGKRADSVKLWLVRNGVLPSRLQASGRGMSEPIDSNDTEYGRAVNRRVQAMRIM